MSSFDDLEDLAKGKCLNSFSPETRVLMADGTIKVISKIRVGDKVRATDPTTGRTSSRQVTQLHINSDTQLVDLTVKTPGGHTALVHTTEEHPFWDPARRQWVNAGDLQSGEALRGDMPRAQVFVGDVHQFTGQRTMYNLTVADVHTYYVVAGNTMILVHNEACATLPLTSGSDDIAVIGGRESAAKPGDVEVAKSWPIHEVLDLDEWDPVANQR